MNVSNANINKVIYGGRTLIDLTADTVSVDNLLAGYSAHNKAGMLIVGGIEKRSRNDISINGSVAVNEQQIPTAELPAGAYGKSLTISFPLQFVNLSDNSQQMIVDAKGNILGSMSRVLLITESA